MSMSFDTTDLLRRAEDVTRFLPALWATAETVVSADLGASPSLQSADRFSPDRGCRSGADPRTDLVGEGLRGCERRPVLVDGRADGAEQSGDPLREAGWRTRQQRRGRDRAFLVDQPAARVTMDAV